MSDTIRSAAAATSPKFVMERTYRASVDELWELWTTKEGFESWFAPEGSRVEVHSLELRPGGELLYTSSATTLDQIDFLKTLGLPAAHEERLRFTKLEAPRHLTCLLLLDFIPGVDAYEVEINVDLEGDADRTTMVMTSGVMHSERFTELAELGWESQLRNMARALSEKQR